MPSNVIGDFEQSIDRRRLKLADLSTSSPYRIHTQGMDGRLKTSLQI